MSKRAPIMKFVAKVLKCMYKTGTDNGWTYRKYADGTYDAWIRLTPNVEVKTASGNLYMSAAQTVNLPSFQDATGYSIVGNANGDEDVVFGTLTSSGETITYKLVRGSSRNAAARGVRLFLHGNWGG